MSKQSKQKYDLSFLHSYFTGGNDKTSSINSKLSSSIKKEKKMVNFNTNYKQFSWRTNWILVNWWDAMSSCLHLKSSHWLQRHQLYSLTIEENVNDNQQNVNDNE